MRIAVTGGDRRFGCLKEILKKEGHEVQDYLDGAELTICRWPNDFSLTEGKIVSCGPGYAPEGVTDLLKNEEYQQNIAWMTAEGAVAAAMMRTDCAIRGAKCMVVGWGRIGRALTEILCALGGNVIALSRRRDAEAEIRSIGAEFGFTADVGKLIGDMRFVFSTPPYMVIDEPVLKNVRNDAAVIDLASPPYGVDMTAAARLGVNAWREPGVPGRYCPENAARAIYDAARGIIDG
ncbi:MAG: hypothetical protein IJC56_02755 [Clostridia bacterium]|nr:hypothetical protein [Clostridia bacterium]